MAALSKRVQLEIQGWKFTPVPRFWAEGALAHNSRTGWKSPAHHDYKHPEAWIATPPAGLPISERRFEHSSPNLAVRWAYGQAKAPRMAVGLSGVAALAALMGEAQSSGVVADVQDEAKPAPTRPDAELLTLCREVLASRRLADQLLEDRSSPWTDREAFKVQADRLSEVHRERDHLVPLIFQQTATTLGGVGAMALVVRMLFANSRGLRADAVRSLVGDLMAVLQREGERTYEA